MELDACRRSGGFAAKYETLSGCLASVRARRLDDVVIGQVNKGKPWSDGRKLLLGCALDCAETVRHLWPESQRTRIENSIRVLRNWIEGSCNN